MYSRISRRRFLAASVAAAALPNILQSQAQTASAVPTANLAVERRTIDVNGRAASVFGIRQPDGTPGLVLNPGEAFHVNVANRCREATIVHWHGQTPPFLQDGVVETGGSIIRPDVVQTYDFAARPGTHWMHSHHGLQEQALMAAPLIVRTPEDLRADVHEVVVLLHDFTFRDPAEVLAQVTGGQGMQQGMSGMAPSMTMDLNDIDYDAYLANDRALGDPLVVRAERNGRVRLRLINGATSTAFWIDLGATKGTVLAVDGNPVRPVSASRFPLAQGQRLDLLITMPAGGGVIPVLAQREGDRARTGIILATPDARIVRIADQAATSAGPIDLSLEHRLVAAAPLGLVAAASPILKQRISLTGTMMPYTWSMDDLGWNDRKPLHVQQGQRIVLEMANRSMMAHPMHLHGHHFQVVGINRKALNGPMRDTVLVPVGGTVTIAFDADNPGRWLLHCHNLLHMANPNV